MSPGLGGLAGQSRAPAQLRLPGNHCRLPRPLPHLLPPLQPHDLLALAVTAKHNTRPGKTVQGAGQDHLTFSREGVKASVVPATYHPHPGGQGALRMCYRAWHLLLSGLSSWVALLSAFFLGTALWREYSLNTI